MSTHANLIYCKTDKGRLEVTERQHGLTSRQRSALIIIDGAKTIDVLAEIIPIAELEQSIPFLNTEGFIMLADALHKQQLQAQMKAPTAPAAPIIAIKAGLTQDTQRVSEVRAFMANMANVHLGLMGADVISRIQRCHNAEQLMAVAAFWHMAIRESRTGNPFATTFMEQIKCELSADMRVLE